MNRFHSRPALVAAVLMVLAGGCQKKSPPPAPTNVAAPEAKPTPEASFATIVETFRGGIEDVHIGFVVQDDSGGQTLMTGRNTVSHQLLPPQKDGEAYKATITVKSDTQYSLQRLTEKPDPTDADQSDDSASEGPPNGSDVEIFDPAVASAPGGGERRVMPGKADPNAVPVAQEKNEYERTYDLVYENGRWKLVTKLDPKTEESIQLAFDRALDSQS